MSVLGSRVFAQARGGLRIKHLELFNLSLLSKWRWHFLVDHEAIWYNLLRFKYGSLENQVSYGLEDTELVSLWWHC